MIRQQRIRVENRAVIALGSNLGDREVHLHSAIAQIGELAEVRVLAASDLVQTAAMKPGGVDVDAPRYLNAVVTVFTPLTAAELLDRLHEIELAHGRVRAERWGDRTLDLDIIVFGTTIASSPLLTLPHPRAAERAFVLAPWLQIEPDAVLPGAGRVAELLARLDDHAEPYRAVEVRADDHDLASARDADTARSHPAGSHR